jgi:hypothetical protein
MSIIFLALAAICNAIMDTCVHHYYNSIFSKLDPNWWNGETSWKNKYFEGDPTKGRRFIFLGINYPVQLTDAFHFFKMLMIFFICASIISYTPCELFIDCGSTFLSQLIMFVVYGVVWNSTFSVFYNKLLIKRNL